MDPDWNPPKLCIDVHTSDCASSGDQPGDTAVYKPHGTHGATQAEVMKWFHQNKTLADAPLLRFSNLAGAVTGFADTVEQSQFSELVSKSLLPREEIRRNARDLVSKIGGHNGEYVCVDLRGSGKDQVSVISVGLQCVLWCVCVKA